MNLSNKEIKKKSDRLTVISRIIQEIFKILESNSRNPKSQILELLLLEFERSNDHKKIKEILGIIDFYFPHLRILSILEKMISGTLSKDSSVFTIDKFREQWEATDREIKKEEKIKVSDSSFIPDKLYGREEYIDLLVGFCIRFPKEREKIFQTCVLGSSSTGMTVLINKVGKTIKRKIVNDPIEEYLVDINGFKKALIIRLKLETCFNNIDLIMSQIWGRVRGKSGRGFRIEEIPELIHADLKEKGKFLIILIDNLEQLKIEDVKILTRFSKIIDNRVLLIATLNIEGLDWEKRSKEFKKIIMLKKYTLEQYKKIIKNRIDLLFEGFGTIQRYILNKTLLIFGVDTHLMTIFHSLGSLKNRLERGIKEGDLKKKIDSFFIDYVWSASWNKKVSHINFPQLVALASIIDIVEKKEQDLKKLYGGIHSKEKILLSLKEILVKLKIYSGRECIRHKVIADLYVLESEHIIEIIEDTKLADKGERFKIRVLDEKIFLVGDKIVEMIQLKKKNDYITKENLWS